MILSIFSVALGMDGGRPDAQALGVLLVLGDVALGHLCDSDALLIGLA